MTTDDRATVHLLRRIVISANAAAAEFAGEHDLNSTDLRALIALLDRARAAEDATPGWLGSTLGITSASTTTLIDRLVARRFVQRVRDATDRRRVLLSVTAEAERTGETFFGPWFQRVEGVNAEFSSGDMATVRRYLTLVADEFSGDESAG